jgi:PIN domain nuclease of toxin-antitoxin system
MILLDTHVCAWWVHGDVNLPRRFTAEIDLHESEGIGVSVISCWEVVKLVEYGRLSLPCPIQEWMDAALAYPGVELINLSPPLQ